LRRCYPAALQPAAHEAAAAVRELITLSTRQREELVDLTREVAQVVRRSGVKDGLVSVYAQGATAAIMVQENWDRSVQTDVVTLLRQLIPRGVWRHDAQDGNGDAHLKAGLVGPSETIPIIDGQLGLSTWQNVFLCEFDGPRQERRVVVTVIADAPAAV
jgi:secondary thiamine-phosphate synthase enzyme